MSEVTPEKKKMAEWMLGHRTQVLGEVTARLVKADMSPDEAKLIAPAVMKEVVMEILDAEIATLRDCKVVAELMDNPAASC